MISKTPLLFLECAGAGGFTEKLCKLYNNDGIYEFKTIKIDKYMDLC